MRMGDVVRTEYTTESFDLGTGFWTSGCSGSCQSWNQWGYVYPFFSNFDNWATDSFDPSVTWEDTYEPNTTVSFTSPVSLIPSKGARLSFRAWWDLGSGDFVIVQARTSSSPGWQTIGIWWGTNESISPVQSLLLFGSTSSAGTLFEMDISSLSGQFGQLRFILTSDESDQGDGLYLDDVAVTEINLSGYGQAAYTYSQGTSFSAPVVTGVAALVMAQRPDLTHLQVRDAILNSVDVIPNLIGRVATGGRVNARSALATAMSLCVNGTSQPGSTVCGLANEGFLIQT